MDSFEINKILGAFCSPACACCRSTSRAEAVFTPGKPAKPGYEVAATEAKGGGAEAAKPEPDEPIEQRLASATPQKGESAAKKCVACHTFGKGEPNRVGPEPLWRRRPAEGHRRRLRLLGRA